MPGAIAIDTAGVSVVLCAYTERRWSDLVAAVDSAQRQDPAPAQVIVVIDHNESLLARARQAMSGVEVIANEQAQGLSGARNTGIRHARGQLVAFLDDDATAQPGWLSNLRDGFAEPGVIGVGGVVLPRWETDAPAWLPPEFLWVVGCSYTGQPSGRIEIRNPIGANMAFRRSVLEQVGGFTDGIGRIGRTPLGCEETELSIRARAVTGGTIVQVPEARVDHRVTADRTGWRYFRRRCWAEGLSKAVVSACVGSDAALASERRYVTRTLPAGIWRGIMRAARGQRGGLASSGAILAGLLITALGYAWGRIAGRAQGAGAAFALPPAPQPVDQGA